MGKGIAKNTAAAVQWLDSCEAVIDYRERDSESLEFTYDESVEVYAVPEHLVSFEAE